MEGIKHNKSYDPTAITLVKSACDGANVDKSNGAEIYIVPSDLEVSIQQSKVSYDALAERTVRSGAVPQNSMPENPVSLLDCTLENTKNLTEAEAIELLSYTFEAQFMEDGKSMPLPPNAIKDYRDYRYDENKGVGFYKTFPTGKIVLMFLLLDGEQIVRQLIDRIPGDRLLQLIGENKVAAGDFVDFFSFDKDFFDGDDENIPEEEVKSCIAEECEPLPRGKADELKVTLFELAKKTFTDPNPRECLENQLRSFCSHIIDKLPRPNEENAQLWDNIANVIGKLRDANKRREAY
jgi:hypothetical protein